MYRHILCLLVWRTFLQEVFLLKGKEKMDVEDGLFYDLMVDFLNRLHCKPAAKKLLINRITLSDTVQRCV